MTEKSRSNDSGIKAALTLGALTLVGVITAALVGVFEEQIRAHFLSSRPANSESSPPREAKFDETPQPISSAQQASESQPQGGNKEDATIPASGPYTIADGKHVKIRYASTTISAKFDNRYGASFATINISPAVGSRITEAVLGPSDIEFTSGPNRYVLMIQAVNFNLRTLVVEVKPATN